MYENEAARLTFNIAEKEAYLAPRTAQARKKLVDDI